MKSHKFSINYLDHVAIRVRDLEESALWYSRVLGLERFQAEEWGPWPIFMLAGKTGIALFPRKEQKEDTKMSVREMRSDHFAFMVSKASLDHAMKHLDTLNIKYEWQDHYHFHSIYMQDPDGYKVELTCLIHPDNPPY